MKIEEISYNITMLSFAEFQFQNYLLTSQVIPSLLEYRINYNMRLLDLKEKHKKIPKYMNDVCIKSSYEEYIKILSEFKFVSYKNVLVADYSTDEE